MINSFKDFRPVWTTEAGSTQTNIFSLGQIAFPA
jgi:hypothetical protein